MDFLIVNPTHDLRYSSTSDWNTAFFTTVLALFPEDIRPVFLNPLMKSRSSPLFVHRCVGPSSFAES